MIMGEAMRLGMPMPIHKGGTPLCWGRERTAYWPDSVR
jgi:hypothetical protein